MGKPPLAIWTYQSQRLAINIYPPPQFSSILDQKTMSKVNGYAMVTAWYKKTRDQANRQLPHKHHSVKVAGDLVIRTGMLRQNRANKVSPNFQPG